MSKLILPSIAAAAILLGVLQLELAPGQPAHAGLAGGPTTCGLQLMSGNGMVGGQDTLNEFSIDGGNTWQPTSLIISPVINNVGVQVWANPIAGSEWIVGDLNVFYNGPVKTIYRTIFTPLTTPTSATAAVTVSVHADNAVAVELNGQQIGGQTIGAPFANFQDPPEVFVSSAPLHSGTNELRFSVSNIDSVQGLDYLATVEYDCARPTPACVNPPSGMAAWWPLDETTGATVVSDISGGGHNGTPQQAPVGPGTPNGGPAPGAWAQLVPPAVVGGSLYFYTNQTYVQVPHQASIEPGAGDFSLGGWVYPVQVGSGQIQPIADKFDAASNIGYALYIESPSIPNNARLTFVYGDGSLNLMVQSISPIAYTQWHHVAVTVKRTLTPPPGGKYLEVELYVDGAADGIQQVGNPVASITTNLDLLIGGARIGPMQGFGEIGIDDVQLFNRALSSSEIAGIQHAGSAGKCRPTPTARRTPTISDAPTATATRTRTPTLTPHKACGDVNDDGRVNSIDATLMLQLVAGRIAHLPNLVSADVNRDGEVNAIDVALVLQMDAGLLADLQCE